MYKIAIIISINDNRNQLKCLNSIKNQTLKEGIQLIGVSNSDNLPKKNKIPIFNSMQNALSEINCEYILFIEGTDYFSEDLLNLSYNYAINNDLDVLYIPITDENIENDRNGLNENFQIISQFNFIQFCKKTIVDTLNWNNNLFYEIQKNSKKIDYLDQKIYFRKSISPENIKKYTEEFLNAFPENQDTIFTMLFTYLMNYPLNSKQIVYDIIKQYFEFDKINKENQEIYNLIKNNKYLIDFLTEYMLISVNYEIYENPLSNNNNYQISVIIPIFNNETLIHRTLMSIENQSLGIENIEILMINDSSTDNTKEVINEYVNKYTNFKAIHIKNGTGSAGTPRNLGLKLASANYVIFIDHDDFLEINALEKLYDKITKYNCDFVFGTYVLINQNETIKFIYPNEKHGYFKNIEDNAKSIRIPPSIWTKLFKKEFLEKNSILFPTILGEDAIFMAKALKNANGIYYLWNDVICYYNLNESSYSVNPTYYYFVEGFTSEKYLYNLFNDWEQIENYKIRGQGILDFYINRVLSSKLSSDEIIDLFPLFYDFCNSLNELKVKPKLEKNNVAFEYIINNDMNGFLKFKNYSPNKIKVFANKIFNKINKYVFW